MYGPDIYTGPDGDPDTVANLGPLHPMAGVWEGTKGSDQYPVVEGTEENTFVEHYELHPIDRQTNGPQLFYGLRYHTHITKPGEVETFHDQVGYWLYEPAAEAVTLTLGIPRGQVLLASGPAGPEATEFELTATAGSEVHGILSTNGYRASFNRRIGRSPTTCKSHPGSRSHRRDDIRIPGQRPARIRFKHCDGALLQTRRDDSHRFLRPERRMRSAYQ